jgi:hypothetical protein
LEKIGVGQFLNLLGLLITLAQLFTLSTPWYHHGTMFQVGFGHVAEQATLVGLADVIVDGNDPGHVGALNQGKAIRRDGGGDLAHRVVAYQLPQGGQAGLGVFVALIYDGRGRRGKTAY